jgi:ATP citrate (pro-S)-lyase
MLGQLKPVIIALGSHPGIIQSILDYSYCIGDEQPSVIAIIAGGRKQERYFWGETEIIIPVYPSLSKLPEAQKPEVNCLLNVQSARRVLSSMQDAFSNLPNLRIATIFAEQVPEKHALEVSKLAKQKSVLVAGPSSVGVLIPGIVKLGAIGGTGYPQIVNAKIFERGDMAVVSTSGGMVNELIHTVTGSGHRVSIAIALGGDRYPATNPADAFLLAEQDVNTKRIVFFGELGGEDEYVLADLIKAGKITKPVIAYIAGTVAELFDEPPQFGHAKAMASKQSETASAKKAALKAVGVNVIDVFADLGEILSKENETMSEEKDHKSIGDRRKHLIVSRISGDVNGDVQLLNQDLLTLVEKNSLAAIVISLFLGKQVSSEKLINFTDYVLRLLVDHGPYVSGAINTIVAARAGKDLTSSLSAGLLTIGPRFGGAVNAAAGAWLEAANGTNPKDFVVNYKDNGGIIPGIGHKKYRIDMPDPRVDVLVKKFSGTSNGDRYLKFAKGVEEVTTSKKGNLILNVDGAIAAIMLDLLESELSYTPEQLQELVQIEFFNAIFVLSRSVGFMSHYLDQKRHDEGLLRFGEDEVAYIP